MTVCGLIDGGTVTLGGVTHYTAGAVTLGGVAHYAATLGGVLGRAKRQSRAAHYVGGEEVEGVVEEAEGFGGQKVDFCSEAL